MSSPDEVNPYQSPKSPPAGILPASPYAGHHQATLEELEQRVAALEWRLQRSWLFSSSFFTRALAVFGHWFVLYLLFTFLMMIVFIPITILVSLLER